MKHLNKVIFAAAATLALVSCNKEAEKNNTERETVVRTVQFDAGPVTKTVFGTPENGEIPTLWTENKTVGISLNFAAAKESSTPELIGGGETARFTADIEDSGSSPYTFYAVSPNSSIVGVQSANNRFNIEIPTSQEPSSTSVDEGAQILVARHEAGNIFPTNSILMNFEHFTAYGKISFKNLSLANGEKITSVSLTAAENWVGRYFYYFEDKDTFSEGDIVEYTGSKTITLTTSSSTNIWFACAPVDLRGKTIKVVISTDAGNTYTKIITIPTDTSGDKHLFKAGKVVAFTIDMDGIPADGPVEYELVTNASDLTVGSEVIIAASESDVAMSTTQNTNNRGETSVTKDGNKIVSPGDAVQILTITEGKKENTIAFRVGADGGYLAAASSGSNWLHTDEDLTNESSWAVSITQATGVATVIAQGSYTRNVLKYNSNNSIFACYASGQQAIAIYKKADNTNWVLSSIAVTTAPTKIIYEAGEFFDPTGMVVTATYKDASDNSHTKEVELDNSDLNFDPNTTTALTQENTSVTITYNEKTTSQDITVTAPIIWVLNSIAVTTEPTKTTYTEGEYFDPTGLVVTATYEEQGNTSNKKNVTVNNDDLTFNPSTSTALTTSNVSVTITYNDKSTTQAITVNADSGEHYVKVTSLSEVTSGEYIIVNNNTYLPNASTTSAPAAVAATISNDEVQSVTDAMTWTFSGTTSAMTIKSTASGTPYLYAINNNNGIRIGNTNDTWEIATNGNGFSLKSNTRNRYCATTNNNGGDWRSYTTADSEYYRDGGVVYLYKLVDNTVWDLTGIEVTTPPTKTTYEAGEYFDPTGMVVTATYEDQAGVKPNKTETIALGDLTLTPNTATALTTDDTAITITYSEQTTSQSITVTAPEPKAITFSQPTGEAATAGCSFTVSVAGQAIASGTSVASGTTVTLTATAGTDYEFTSWTVIGATVTDAAAASTTFTMGTSAVTVSASFTSTSVTKIKRYVKVTSGTIGGEYLIVRESSNYVYDGSLANPDDASNYRTASNLSSLDYDDWKDYAVTIESYSTGYSIQTAAGYYIGRNANSNGIDSSTTLGANYVNAISFAANGTVTILGKGGRKFNFNSSSSKFRYFASGNTTEIYLYQLQEIDE